MGDRLVYCGSVHRLLHLISNAIPQNLSASDRLAHLQRSGNCPTIDQQQQ
jgi:hypothetical protein